MEKLIIIDYSISHIDIYDLDEDFEVTEDFITSLGYNIDEIYYIFSNDIKINIKGNIKDELNNID